MYVSYLSHTDPCSSYHLSGWHMLEYADAFIYHNLFVSGINTVGFSVI